MLIEFQANACELEAGQIIKGSVIIPLLLNVSRFVKPRRFQRSFCLFC